MAEMDSGALRRMAAQEHPVAAPVLIEPTPGPWVAYGTWVQADYGDEPLIAGLLQRRQRRPDCRRAGPASGVGVGGENPVPAR